MKKPKVSIVMPTYKKLGYLKIARNSVLNQTYTDYEIIITDDSQNDVIKDYISRLNNEKIRYFNNRPALRQAANHTAGMKQARGEFIKILHDDDYFLTNDALYKMVRLLEDNPDCDFAHVNNIQVDLLTGRVIRKRRAQKYVGLARKEPLSIFKRNAIGAPSVTIFRNYNDTFFDEKMRLYIDTDFYINYLLKHPKIAFSKEHLIAIGENPEQDTHKVAEDKDIFVFESIYIYKKYEGAILKSEIKKDFEKYINDRMKELKVTKEEIQKQWQEIKNFRFIKAGK